MKLTRAQLQVMITEAQRRFVEMPAETRLMGDPKSLNERERVGLSYLIAALGVVARLGSTDPELDLPPDSDPDTEP